MGANQTGVPGVPTAALNAISDENTRLVLQAIVDGWNVRNGTAGSGDARFITRDEVAGLVRTTVAGGAGAGQSSGQGGNQNNNGVRPSDIARIISDLQAQIMQSALWRDLGARIDLIDRPGGLFTRVGLIETVFQDTISQYNTDGTSYTRKWLAIGNRVAEAEGALTNETVIRVANDNAISRAVQTIWSAVGDSTALIQNVNETLANNTSAVARNWNQTQAAIKDPVTGAYIASATVREEAQTAVNKAGELEGKYTVKVDVNGYVAGFGLAVTSNNAVPTSSFIVRSDSFAIGSPGAELNPALPFIVRTTPTTINSRPVPAGVYIADAFIADGTITTAKIGVAQVDTLVIDGNSVTQPVVVANNPYQDVYTNEPEYLWTTVGTIAVDMGQYNDGTMSILLLFSYVPKNFSGGSWSTAYRMVNDYTGTTVFSGSGGVANNADSVAMTSFGLASIPQGVWPFSLQVRNYGDINGNSGVQDVRLMALGAKR